MTYTSATLGADANPAQAFMTALDPLLTAGGFTFVEEWTSGANTARIYKSPAGSNAQGADWYLNVYRASNSATSVTFGVAEVWDATNKKFKSYAPTVSTRTPNSSYGFDETTGTSPNGSGTIHQKVITVSASGNPYWTSINPNRIVIATRVSSTDYAVYAGLYDSLQPSSIDPFPLCVLTLASNATQGSTTGSSTREPGVTTSTSNAFGVTVATTTLWGPAFAGSDLYQATNTATRVFMHSSRSTVSNLNAVRGLLKDMVYCAPSGAVNGDTLTVTKQNGTTETFTRMGDGGSMHVWASQAV